MDGGECFEHETGPVANRDDDADPHEEDSAEDAAPSRNL
jgi:hypothetical protein